MLEEAGREGAPTRRQADLPGRSSCAHFVAVAVYGVDDQYDCCNALLPLPPGALVAAVGEPAVLVRLRQECSSELTKE